MTEHCELTCELDVGACLHCKELGDLLRALGLWYCGNYGITENTNIKADKMVKITPRMVLTRGQNAARMFGETNPVDIPTGMGIYRPTKTGSVIRGNRVELLQGYVVTNPLTSLKNVVVRLN